MRSVVESEFCILFQFPLAKAAMIDSVFKAIISLKNSKWISSLEDAERS